jgi:ornithine cyclodeaminase/alanine dehydrogenase-like protein (mu-crystallin family)
MHVKPILYLSEKDVQQTLTVAEAVELAEKGIRAEAKGGVAGDKFYMPVEGNGFIKPFSGYMTGEELAFVKTFSYFEANPTRFNLPATSSMVILFDAQNGYPVCLMEGGWVTGLKTGASTTITAQALARPDARTLLIFGAGLQGRMHLRALSLRFDFQKVWVADRHLRIAEKFVQEMQGELGLDVSAVDLDEREAVVRDAEIIVTVTTGNMPLVYREWLKPGAFVARLGSYQELDLEVITQADKVIVDRWSYVRPRIPELIALAEGGQFQEENLHGTWADVLAGRCPGRESAEEIIVYLALGTWGEYAAILPQVYRRAKSLGLGQYLGTGG